MPNASKSISDALDEVSLDPGQLKNMSVRSLEIVRELLDYKKLAARIYVLPEVPAAKRTIDMIHSLDR